MNRPLALVCYICGREFGTKSLGIHIKTCEKKWQNEESLKPPKNRRPCPRPPPGLEQLLAKPNITRQDIQNFNTGSFNTFKDEALMECQNCGRKFNPKSLGPHQKACTKSNPMTRKPYVSKNQAQQIQSPTKVPSKAYSIPNQAMMDGNENMNLVSCRKCGRKFNSDRVAKHEKICKGAQKKVPTITEKYQLKPKPVSNKGIGGKLKQQQQPKWKIQSEELQNAMKQMRKVKAIQQKGGDLSKLPPPPKSNYDHYVECKYCGRKYAAEVAQRHIPKCANIINKPGGIKPSKIQDKYLKGTGSSIKSSAVEKTQSNKLATKPQMMMSKRR